MNLPRVQYVLIPNPDAYMASSGQSSEDKLRADRPGEGCIASSQPAPVDELNNSLPRPAEVTSTALPSRLGDSVTKVKRACGPNRLKASFHVRSAASVVLIVIFTVPAFVVFRGCTALRPYMPYMAIFLGLAGLLLLPFRARGGARQLDEDFVLHFYLHPRYWSFVLLVSAGLVFTLCSAFLRESAQPPPRIVARARPQPVREPPTPIADFPPIHVTGVLLNGPRSSAVMDDETVLLGEYIQGVKLVEVFANGVVVERDGFQKILPLEAGKPPSDSSTSRERGAGRSGVGRWRE